MSRKYLLNGKEVEVMQELSNGFLVSNIYRYDDAEDIVDSGNAYFVSKVFDSAPTEVLDYKIVELEKQIADYTKKRNDIQKEYWDANEQRKKQIDLHKKSEHPAIQMLDSILDKSVTHFVYCRYGQVNIVKCADLFKYQSDYSIYFTMNLTYNTAEYRINLRDDNHTNVDALPCQSYEQAFAVAEKILNEAFAKTEKLNWQNEYIASAKRLGVAIPEDYILAVKNDKKSRIERTISLKDDEIKKLQTELLSIS